ncbi:Gas vesicle protein G [Streptomyces sp. DvalAA-14]|uniref:gas vesicle protein GvpG n=1 Tax=unclassified Streptomyces TaxID=2593676 RepID=UPI00081B9B5E|nr:MULTISPECIES: gas vesicle protein GvpG [unclassified Streptomyces]MYS21150.1 gas vesicle protein [Streptomyces sp. SID4948]SCD85394.1 Gas vesicle protein G [Streptomyces sp. DvalAA-14]
MGLLKGLIMLPLAPVRGVEWISQVVLDTAAKELYDPAALRARLAALNRAYDEGRIDTEQFEREEGRLLDLLTGPAGPTGPTESAGPAASAGPHPTLHSPGGIH